MPDLIFFDIEISPDSGELLDIGAIRENGSELHTSSVSDFTSFIRGGRFFCGHNIIAHDLVYTGDLISTVCPGYFAVDTLCLSPLLFPRKPYHRLLKDDKLQSGTLNNPLNDAVKARELFYDECSAFHALPPELQDIFCGLLQNTAQFSGFFSYLGLHRDHNVALQIRQFFSDLICEQADLAPMIEHAPAELAYALALIRVDDKNSITPPWVIHSFPRIEHILKLLRDTPCQPACGYCRQKLDVQARLREIFGYEEFRTYDGEPLQKKAAAAAVAGDSLLAVFPTGGGKSITFQLPALIAGESVRGLTVVISPLQSLMKDQVDNLEQRGIVDAVTINGMLDPIERKAAIDRVASGMASILYISPESLRSKTIEKLLLSRNVIRFVIDEAHCFSSWGQDFRVDYMYIGDFIRSLQEQKHLPHGIPVSCFTATAKQKVISDIQDYFRRKLGLELRLFTTSAARTNLHYAVLYKETEEDKFITTRSLIQAKNCPTIIYVSRVAATTRLAERLRHSGFSAQPYNGRMERTEKIRVQNAFIQGDIQIIVATSAFGMGVDKKDVRLVIHYEISDSLENYVQEAGRAGRDSSIEADCYVLFNDEDLDKHFILLNQTKLSISEIQQVWHAVKMLTKHHSTINCSALEIARAAGWDDSVRDIETRVTTAVCALENAGYISRGRNSPRVYADSIQVANMMQAAEALDASPLFTEKQRENAKRIIGFMISRAHTKQGAADQTETRVDYIADRLGLQKEEAIGTILLMREAGILADHTDLTAHIRRSDSHSRSSNILNRFLLLERYLIDNLPDGERINYRELNDQAIRDGIPDVSVKNIRTVVFYWTLCGQLKKGFHSNEERVCLERTCSRDVQLRQFERRLELSTFIMDYLYEKCDPKASDASEESLVCFSVREVQQAYNKQPARSLFSITASTDDVQNTLLYLSKIRALSLDGGFLVSYNSMQIRRIELDNRIKFKQSDYSALNEFYQQRVQQIHVVGEYAHLMVRDYEEALQFVSDYFRLDYQAFLLKYFKGTRRGEINRNITPEKYTALFGTLSAQQREIIDDSESRYIVVAAGPGSGKTRVLVHKLASLLMLEDVKHEQLLMLTFSRAAATEFKRRLIELIGPAAYYVEIRTFHSYCFDLLGRIGNLEESADVVKKAAAMILHGDIEPDRITKTVVVIDEAQDMDVHAYALVRALMVQNETMRLIAVGDDDQNIFSFRGSDSRYMRALSHLPDSRQYELLENYRSSRKIVALSNAFAETISDRMKSAPIIPASSLDGTADITFHNGENLEVPLVRHLVSASESGTRCILTVTNDSALQITGLLLQQGIPAKLIQSNDEFDLYNLAEIRFFLRLLDNPDSAPIIDSERWLSARERLASAYAESTCLPVCLSILDTFNEISRPLYHSDLIEFLHESRLEDFAESSGDAVLVSTMHKAKGREFDHVYLVLENYGLASAAAKRAVYVAMTRARRSLHIHTNDAFFRRFSLPEIRQIDDLSIYSKPEELILQLSHRDVFLGYFKGRKQKTLSLRSGCPLFPDGTGLRTADGTTVLRFSAAFRNRLKRLSADGYIPVRAVIRFIVAWKYGDDADETAVILPDLILKTQSPHPPSDSAVFPSNS